MPPPETFHRHQTAVLWRKIGDNAQGEPIFDEPEELTPRTGTGVRWEAGGLNPLDDNREPVNIDAVVVVNTDIVVGSEMWLGTLEEWIGVGSATDYQDDRMRVIKLIKVPDLKRRKFRREVWLLRAQTGPVT